jgi:hypothetical protein
MTDFIAYISAQQRMQANMNDTEATDIPRPGGRRLVAWSSIHGMRRRTSIALYRLAAAIQPIGDPASAMVNAPR